MDVKGYFINLEESKERRIAISRHLNELGCAEQYSRFPAVRGEANSIMRRGLTRGEQGLWITWMNLLASEADNTEDYEYLHIIEDDALLGKDFLSFMQSLKKQEIKFDMLVTDMYVNPAVYLKLANTKRRLEKKNEISITPNLYTGCLSSCIIRKTNLPKIFKLLKLAYYGEEDLIPLDNYFYRLVNEKRINICSTMPMLTSIRIEDINKSTIQNNQEEDSRINASRKICTFLRRDLSIIKREADITKLLVEALIDLEDQKNNRGGDSNIKNLLLDTLVKLIYSNKLLRYKVEPRLANEPFNEQSREVE